jgi:hypothetical protein
LAIASELNATDLLSQLLSCTNATTSDSQAAISSLFNANVGTNTAVSNALLGSLATGTIAPDPSLTTALVTNPNLTSSDVSGLTSILTKLGVTPNTVLQTGQTINNEPVWNSGVMAAMSPTTISALSSDPSIPLMVNGSSLDLSKDFAIGGVY